MSLRSKARDFIECLDGAITALGLFLLLTMLGIGGLAIDYANAVHVKTHLQVAADSVGDLRLRGAAASPHEPR